MPIAHQKVLAYPFLRVLYADWYFPDHVVDRGKEILLRLCERIEAGQPTDLTALYALIHTATKEFHYLGREFEAAGSEMETVAREQIGGDFSFIASVHGFAYADVEELTATRGW